MRGPPRGCIRKETVNGAGGPRSRLVDLTRAAIDVVQKVGILVGIAAYVVVTVGVFGLLGVVQKLVERL